MFKELFNSLNFFPSLHEYLCSHCRKMDQNPIFKMESSFSVSEFRGKLNSGKCSKHFSRKNEREQI